MTACSSSSCSLQSWFRVLEDEREKETEEEEEEEEGNNNFTSNSGGKKGASLHLMSRKVEREPTAVIIPPYLSDLV